MYLMLANTLVHSVRPDAIIIAEEVSGYPSTHRRAMFYRIVTNSIVFKISTRTHPNVRTAYAHFHSLVIDIRLSSSDSQVYADLWRREALDLITALIWPCPICGSKCSRCARADTEQRVSDDIYICIFHDSVYFVQMIHYSVPAHETSYRSKKTRSGI